MGGFFFEDYLLNNKNKKAKKSIKICELKKSKVLYLIKYFVNKIFEVVL